MSFLKSKKNKIFFLLGLGLLVLGAAAAILVGCLTRVPPERTLFNYGDFDYVLVEDGVEIVAYNGNDSVVVIPTAIDGEFVTSVGDGAFYGTTVTEVTVSDFVTRIGRGAFYNCTALKKVKFGDSVRTVGESAFYNCLALTELNLPDSLTAIGESAFYNLAIETLTLPAGITSLPPYAFSYCVQLTAFDTKGTVTEIGEGAFYHCEAMEQLKLDGVKSVGTLAFLSCVKLTEIEIPDTLVSIGVDAFGDCDALAAFKVGEANPSYSSPLGALVDKQSGVLLSYPQSAAATEITLPNDITEIGRRAFADCLYLTEVVLPDGLKVIGEFAFHNAAALKRIALSDTPSDVAFSLPEGILFVGGCAFEETPVLRGIDTEMLIVGDGILIKYTAPRDSTGKIDTDESEYISYESVIVDQNGVSVTMKKYVVTVPSVVKSVSSAFYGERDISVVILPESVEYIGDYAFMNAVSIEKYDMSRTRTAHIGESAFASCQALSEVLLPETLQTVGTNLFVDCVALTSVRLPEGLTAISAFMFGGCTSLSEINVPESVKSLSTYAFSKATALTSFTVGKNLTYIGDYAEKSASPPAASAETLPNSWRVRARRRCFLPA